MLHPNNPEVIPYTMQAYSHLSNAHIAMAIHIQAQKQISHDSNFLKHKSLEHN